MSTLRVIGDVHAQIGFVIREGRPCYLDLIAGAPFSVQVGDMGDEEAFAELASRVDPARHRFFAGNHDHYDCLPAHSLGDFGAASLGGVRFFFVRGAASTDKKKLLETGHRVGRALWFPQEEMDDEQMAAARREFAQTRPTIMMSHDAPTRIARFVHKDTSRGGGGFSPSRTSDFLESLVEIHHPKLWLFGHYHHDWDYIEDDTRFRCVGELSFVDIDIEGTFVPRSPDTWLRRS